MNLRLREIRKAKHRTQSELGKEVGVSMRVVSGWERNETDITLVDAARVADVLECTLDELAGRDFQPDRANSLSPDESSLLGIYRDSNPQGQASIMAVAQAQPGMEAASPPGLDPPAVRRLA